MEPSASLSALLPLRKDEAPDLLRSSDATALKQVRSEVVQFRQALALFLQGEVLRVQASAANERPIIPEEAVEHYLAAYERAPEFVAARGQLYLAASVDPSLAEQIFPRMLARTPDEPRVYRAYLEHLRRVGDEARYRDVLSTAQSKFDEGSDAPVAAPPATRP